MQKYNKGEILILTRDACEFLESLNLSYSEMSSYLGVKLKPKTIKNTFCLYGVKHKSKKVLIKKYMLDNPDKSLTFVARKYDCSRKWVQQIRKEIKNEKSSDI